MKQSFNKIGLSIGSHHAILCGNEGVIYGIGDNSYGQLGIGSYNSTSVPVEIPLSNVIMFDCAPSYSVFLTIDGDVYVCGYTNYVNGTYQYYNTPQKIAEGMVAIATSPFTLFMLTNRGTVKAIGYNGRYNMGRNNTTSATTVVSIDRVSECMGFALTIQHSFFLKTNGTVYGCGIDYNSALGLGTADETYKVPTKVNITNVMSIDTNMFHSLFLKTDGTVYACGYNAFGELGIGNTTTKLTPVVCSGVSGITEIETGLKHSLFLKEDGTVYACGDNTYGQLCTGNNTSSSTPVQCTITGVLGIYAGEYFSAFLKEDGLYFAGLNPFTNI